MPKLRRIEGEGKGGLDPRRARLSRIHDGAIVGLAASTGLFVATLFLLGVGSVSGGIRMLGRAGLAVCGAGVVMSIATIWMVALMFDSDPRTQREARIEEAKNPDPDRPSWLE